DINQYTGFAVRKSIPFANMPDLRINKGNHSKLRFATYITVQRPPLPELHILNVHLKAGCSGRYKNSNNCKVLKEQGENIKKWIDDRERLDNSYIVLGDFNHNMSYPGDWLWKSISSNNSAVLTTRDVQARCKVRSRNNKNKTHQFRNLIDHIISSDDLKTKETAQHIFDTEDVLSYKLSDHCPVSTQVF
ncbi:endonuclease/exonuclease/phosphatase family protein, partial [Vibrio makurazakiensis]|uniref:endonuclease/exonuclease/phosphatase family protein n=1 Tax=Vibrio makurazakiensis TaxID=2910250 RepID=UPI003D142B18